MDGSTGRVQVSIRVPTSLLDALDRIAKATERDRSWVILRAIKHYLDGEGSELLTEVEGLAALDRREGIDADAVEAEAEAIIEEARGRHRRATI